MIDPGVPHRFRPDTALPGELFERVRASVGATPASTINMRLRQAVALALVPSWTALVVTIASQVVYRRQAVGLELGAAPVYPLLLTLSSLVGLTLVATAFALRQGKNGLGSGAPLLAAIASLVAPLYAGLSLVQPIHAAHAAMPGPALSPWGLRCLALAALSGALVLVSFLVALRRAVPVASRMRGAAIGAAAGAWAGLAVFIFCPASDRQHIFVGHVLPILAFTLVGAFTLPRALRP